MIPPALGHGPIRYAEPSPASGPHCQFSLVKGPAVARRRASLISSIVFDIVIRLSMVNPGAAINMTSPKKLIKLILSHAGWESSVKSAMAGEAYTSQLSFRDPDLWGFRESAGPKLLRPEAVVSQTIHQDIKLSVTTRERIHHWIFRSALEASSETPLMILLLHQTCTSSFTTTNPYPRECDAISALRKNFQPQPSAQQPCSYQHSTRAARNRCYAATSPGVYHTRALRHNIRSAPRLSASVESISAPHPVTKPATVDHSCPATRVRVNAEDRRARLSFGRADMRAFATRNLGEAVTVHSGC
jgi:hypothetical protein